ncbi:hypothetical protein [Cohnella caldifontis]|uniref:hypothetical protein n=1 Tax=Cohnella caldifontis TaxID=3027471 RepID=UPI0023EDA002|nr:hypothetical protein [Cohnella sp. YIM B05605]
MTDTGMILYAWLWRLIQFALGFAGIAALLGAALRQRYRWRISRKGWRNRQVPIWFLKLWRADRESVALQARRVWLAGCGLGIDPRLYLAIRRVAIFVLAFIALSLGAAERGGGLALSNRGAAAGIAAALSAAACFDGMMLNALRRYRTDRIRREIMTVARQLLYYSGSRLHLHGKLLRMLPLTRIIRPELGLLLNEWYHDPDRALRRFRERLGTEEAGSFAESLRSLRLHESGEVYDLLRAMVQEYKARIELAREGRKETASYLLFVLAGVPILYTFQVFLYPWVQEAANLFDALNP